MNTTVTNLGEQRLLEEVLLWLKRMPRDSESGRFKTATDLFSRAKLVLKKEREWIVRKEIHDIQEKVCELKRQLNDDGDEDLNDFEVQHNNICNVATVHDKDEDKVNKVKEGCTKVNQGTTEDTEDGARQWALGNNTPCKAVLASMERSAHS
jgi:hypothetical protein